MSLDTFTDMTALDFTGQTCEYSAGMGAWVEFTALLRGTNLRVIHHRALVYDMNFDEYVREAAYRMNRLAAEHKRLKDTTK